MRILLEERMDVVPARRGWRRHAAKHQQADEVALVECGRVGGRFLQGERDGIDLAVDEVARPTGIDRRDSERRAALGVGLRVGRDRRQRRHVGQRERLDLHLRRGARERDAEPGRDQDGRLARAGIETKHECFHPHIHAVHALLHDVAGLGGAVRLRLEAQRITRQRRELGIGQRAAGGEARRCRRSWGSRPCRCSPAARGRRRSRRGRPRA